MAYNVKWTRLENIALFLTIEEETKKELEERTDKELAGIAQKKFPDVLLNRTIDGITSHIKELKKLKSDLNIPDPVHNNNKGFNKY